MSPDLKYAYSVLDTDLVHASTIRHHNKLSSLKNVPLSYVMLYYMALASTSMKSGQKRDVKVSQNVGISISALICLSCPTSSTQLHRTTIQAVINFNILRPCVPPKHLGIILDQSCQT